MDEIKKINLKREKEEEPTWRWLFTCEMVSPLTSINWSTSLGVASTKKNE